MSIDPLADKYRPCIVPGAYQIIHYAFRDIESCTFVTLCEMWFPTLYYVGIKQDVNCTECLQRAAALEQANAKIG